jgi:hypothetical protein
VRSILVINIGCRIRTHVAAILIRPFRLKETGILTDFGRDAGRFRRRRLRVPRRIERNLMRSDPDPGGTLSSRPRPALALAHLSRVMLGVPAALILGW